MLTPGKTNLQQKYTEESCYLYHNECHCWLQSGVVFILFIYILSEVSLAGTSSLYIHSSFLLLSCYLCHIIFLTPPRSSSSSWPSLSFPSPHSSSVCVCWIDCTSGYIFCPHFCSLPLASPSHSSLECRPTVGYYCLIKGRLGRRRPDKSIKLPLAVPEGRWIEMDFVPAREYPRVHLFQMVSEGVYAEAACCIQQ